MLWKTAEPASEASAAALCQHARRRDERPRRAQRGLCDDVLIIGARFPLNIDRPDVALIDCPESEGVNNIQFDHAFAAETACNYLISRGGDRLR